jgi:cell division protein FtsI (penicillin-binding protein 3)
MMPHTENNVAPPAINRVMNNRFRVRVLQIILLILFVALFLRLIQVQIIDSEKYRKIVKKQSTSEKILYADRGSLFDRSGSPLATSIMQASFAVDPSLARDSARPISRTFSRVFGGNENKYFKIIKTDKTRFRWIKRFVDMKYTDVIQKKDYDGIIIQKEPKRFYYHDRIAGQLIGTTDLSDSGIAGIEKYFNKDMRGKNGYTAFQRNGLRQLSPTVDYPTVEPEHGHNIYLTIDVEIQQIAERELRKGAERIKARGGIAIVIQPETGEILAMAQYPQVKPDEFGKFDPEDQRLRAVTDIFEPGSVFKVVTAAAALKDNLVSPKRIFNAENGRYLAQVPHSRPRLIQDIHEAQYYSFEDAMAQSSNIVMAKISDIVGNARFYQMARNFGFGTKTNIEFPGEDQGVLKKPKNWSGTTRNSIAFGYEISATPLQIACAYAAIANDGDLMKPTILKKITDSSGKIIRETEPQTIRNVIPPSTAKTLSRMLEGVVEKGTGKNAQIRGVRVAGKTGTAKKYIDGDYRNDKFIASFAGFFPAENPKIVCLVMIDEPEGSEIYGSTVSAPIFRAIAEQIINTTDFLQPTNTLLTASNEKSVTFPPSAEINDTPMTIVPDVCGMSIRKAKIILQGHKLKADIIGSGIVIDQNPDAGSQITGKRVVRLVCQQKTSAAIGFR